MRILVDECAPRALKKHLMKHGHVCRTVQEAGWSGKKNGELLSLAEADFDVLVTVDTSCATAELKRPQNRHCGSPVVLKPS